MFFYHLGF